MTEIITLSESSFQSNNFYTWYSFSGLLLNGYVMCFLFPFADF